jgi:hypothetical protein
MNQKAIDTRRSIEGKVEDGFVLNNEGQWVHMFEQLTNEQRVIEELARGNVNVNGIWVRITDAKKWVKQPSKNAGSVSPAHPTTAPIMPAVRVTAAAAPKAAPASHVPTAAAPKAAAPAARVPTAAPPAANPAVHLPDGAPRFEGEEDLLETISMDASVIRQIARMAGGGDAENDFSGHDDLRETAVLMIERLNPPAKRG